MNPLKSTLLGLFLLGSLLAIAQNRYSSVKIYAPADKMEKAALIGLLEIDHFQPISGGAIIAEIGEKELSRLKASGYRYEILVDDVSRNLEQLNREYYAQKAKAGPQGRLAFEETGSTVGAIIRTPAAFEVKPGFGGYYSFSEMNAAMNNLATNYPSLVQKTSLGTSYEGRNIWCIKISDNVATDETNEPEVLYLGVQHAREAIGGSSMIFFMQYLCENYASNTRIRELVNNREIFIIPCMNPDGWEYNRTHGGAGTGWRKNRRNNGDGEYGVDLNRNWGIDWGNCSAPISGVASSCGSNNTSSDTYYGTGAFSEPETRAIRDFTYTRNFVAMIDQHSYGPYYSLPFGRPSLPTNVMAPLDRKFYTYVAAAMGNYNGMRAGNSLEALNYEVAGGVKDWMLKGNLGTGTKGKVYGMTGEGGAGANSATFWPPASQIINLCKGMVFQDIQLLISAGSYVNLQDVSDINISATTGSFDFYATRVGLQDAPVTVSLIPIENVAIAGAPVTISSLPAYYDSYSGSIGYTLPASITNGQRLRFAWRIQTGGITYYDTVTKFYNAQQLLYDDMDGSYGTNWSGTNGWGLSAAGTGYGGGSSRAMAESPSGNYTANSTRISTYDNGGSNSFDLSNATAAYMSFWVRHRAENFRDKLQVQVSADGGPWTALVGTTTIQEPGTLDGSTINGIPSLTGIKEDWTRELFNLEDYIGTTDLELRFVFTSDDNSTGFDFQVDDGFYIDELKLVKSTVPLVTLPVHFISFTGKVLPDETIRLDWSAIPDALHDYFDVEKSTDGSSYTSIGRGPADAPYWKIDASPAAGNNFYRIKQVDKDGNFSYGPVINVVYNPISFAVSVYPNPAKDQLTIKLQTVTPDRYNISLTDLAGRKIYQEQVLTGASVKEINIPLKKYASQLYVLIVRNSKGTIIATQKILRE